jgi:hypothetical protein
MNQWSRLIAAVAALIVVSFHAALARATELPTYQPGQAFVFDNGRVELVQAVKGDRVTWAARSGRSYERAVNPIVPILSWSFRGQSGVREIRGNPQRLWPLRAGASVQFQTINITRDEKGKTRRSLHLWTCRVRAAETVTLRVGRISAIPIQCDRFSAGTMRVLERITWHYSPEIGHYVRREARDMRDGVSETITLHATLTPRESNPVRIEALAREASKS